MQLHISGLVVHTEHTCKAALKGYDRAVEDAVGYLKMIALDDRILRIAPDHVLTVSRLFLPRDIGDGFSVDYLHIHVKSAFPSAGHFPQKFM